MNQIMSDKTLAGDLARAMYSSFGGRRVKVSEIYAVTDLLPTHATGRKNHEAVIRATLQSASPYSLQYHGLKDYFDTPRYGVWQLSRNARRSLSRYVERKFNEVS